MDTFLIVYTSSSVSPGEENVNSSSSAKVTLTLKVISFSLLPTLTAETVVPAGIPPPVLVTISPTLIPVVK